MIDGRQSYHQVAAKVGVSVSTVLMRTKKLENAGIIRGYTAILDYQKLGLTVTSITEISTVGGKLQEIEGRLAQMPQANAVYDVSGAIDAIVLGRFRSTAELSKFCKTVQGIANVSRTETHIVLSVVKEEMPEF